MKRGGIIELDEDFLLYLLGVESTSRCRIWRDEEERLFYIQFNDMEDKYNLNLNTEIPPAERYPTIKLDLNYFKKVWLDRILEDYLKVEVTKTFQSKQNVIFVEEKDN